MRLATFLCFICWWNVVLGQEPLWNKVATLQQRSGGGFFGFSVDINEEFAVVGAPRAADRGQNAGAAYSFPRKDGWNGFINVTALYSNDISSNDNFGFPVRVYGPWLFVGAYQESARDLFAGACYIYKWNGTEWLQHQRIIPDGIDRGDYFGIAAVYGNHALFGAFQDEENAILAGNAFAYTLNEATDTWEFVQKFFPSSGAANDRFGQVISMHENYAIISSTAAGVAGAFVGAVYIYERLQDNTWVERARFDPGSGVNEDTFGSNTGIWGDWAVVGSGQEGNGVGAVYIYKRNADNTWEFAQKLTNDRSGPGQFGFSVSIYDYYIAVGALSDSTEGPNDGAVLIYRLNEGQWVQEARLIANDTTFPTASNYGFGSDVRIYKNLLVVGAYFSNRAYIFEGPAYIEPPTDDNNSASSEAITMKWMIVFVALIFVFW